VISLSSNLKRSNCNFTWLLDVINVMVSGNSKEETANTKQDIKKERNERLSTG
jgi:hypothetical protein